MNKKKIIMPKEKEMILKFFNNVCIILKERGMRKQDLRVSHSLISNVIKGRTASVSMNNVFKICVDLSMSFDEILNFKSRRERLMDDMNNKTVVELMKDYSVKEIYSCMINCCEGVK